MKIAVLYIATGKYIIFWNEFFDSCQQLLLPGLQKEYFVFTDATNFYQQQHPAVHTVYHEKQGWPYDTLLRFQTFLKVKEQLLQFDYIYFFNANLKIVKTITPEEFLPNNQTDDGLVAVLHPAFYNKSRSKFTYEKKQKESLAYISKEEGTYYFQGSLNGGTQEAYLQLIETLHKNTQADLEKGIIAVWHDESHLNKYLVTKNPKRLSPAFSYPEGWNLPFEPIILSRDKSKYGGHAFLRGQSQNQSITKKLKALFKKILGR
jgi:hypothetical protein